MYQETDWMSKLDEFGVSLISAMGHFDLPYDHNPITASLRDGDFVERFGSLKGFNKTSVSKAAVICQMNVYDEQRGPDEDGKPKALRRQWYDWYKTRFAQQFSAQLGEAKFKDINWNGLMSQTYAFLVNNCDVTYRDLWVEDASRMMRTLYSALFDGLQIVLAVEKDSLFNDFVPLAENLGAKAVVSGRGKMSKAGTELVLRKLQWSANHNPFTAENPLIVLSVTDWDYDGEAVIAPTFAEQARRYTRHVLEARVGITPEQVAQLLDSSLSSADFSEHWYKGKTSNQAYLDWSAENALFLATCWSCDHEYPVKGTHNHTCPICEFELADLIVVEGNTLVNQPMTFEVEALKTRDFAAAIVDALLSVVPFEWIIQRLREECTANAEYAISDLEKSILEENETYQELKKLQDQIAEVTSAFERKVHDALIEQAEPHTSDWEDEEDDPDARDYQEHVATGYGYKWSPFSEDTRTQLLAEFLADNYDTQDICAELTREDLSVS